MNPAIDKFPPESFTEMFYHTKTFTCIICVGSLKKKKHKKHFPAIQCVRTHLETDAPSIRSYETLPFPWISVMQLHDRGHCGSIKEDDLHSSYNQHTSHLWTDKPMHSAAKCFPGNMIRYKPVSLAAERLLYLRSYVMLYARQLWRRGALITRNEMQEQDKRI